MKNIFLFLAGLISVVSCNAQSEKIQLNARSFNDSVIANSEIVVLDVRSPAEYSKGFLNRAINIDYDGDDFETRIAKLDRNTKYYVYCLAGGRSSSAIREMQKLGLNATELKGGMMAWRKEGLPVIEMESVKDKISRTDYDHLVNDKLVLVDFFAPWCGPCKKMEPFLDELREEFANSVKLIRINIDENKNLAGELGVLEIPVLKIYKQGKETWDHRGFASKPLIERALRSHIEK